MNRIIIFIIVLTVMMCGCTASIRNVTNHVLIDRTLAHKIPDTLKNRVQLYWNLRVNGNFKECWKIEAPHTRHIFPIKKYVTKYDTAKPIRHVEVLRYNDKSTLVDLIIKLDFIDGRSASLSDYWINLDNEWYHVIKDRLRGIK